MYCAGRAVYKLGLEINLVKKKKYIAKGYGVVFHILNLSLYLSIFKLCSAVNTIFILHTHASITSKHKCIPGQDVQSLEVLWHFIEIMRMCRRSGDLTRLKKLEAPKRLCALLLLINISAIWRYIHIHSLQLIQHLFM